MKRMLIVALTALACAGTAHAMDVATFLAKAESLQQKGVMAMFSSESTEMQAELRAATSALRGERLAAQAAGRRPAYCPPEHASLEVPEIIAAMRAVPPARRAQTDIKDALRGAFARKYPCRR